MCLQRMWSISRDKDVPTKIMNRKIVDLQRIQGRVPQRRSLGVLGKDEVASSNLASSSMPLNLLEVQGFFLFQPKSHDLILHIKLLIRDEVIVMKRIEMSTRERKTNHSVLL